MAKSNSFEFDSTRLPEVEWEASWQLADGGIAKTYRVGDWSFEYGEDNIAWAEKGAYAFIAWLQFLKEDESGTEA